MGEKQPEHKPLRLSANLDFPPDLPLPPAPLVDGLEDHDGYIHAVKVSRSKRSGASRERIRPGISACNDASPAEICDAVWAIAYVDALTIGQKQRYVAILDLVEGDGIKRDGARVYFDVDIAIDVETDGAPANGPSHEYVRELERRVLTLVDRGQRAATRAEQRTERMQDRLFSLVETVATLRENRGVIEIERITQEGRERRRDKMLDGVFTMLPKLADKYLPPTNGAEAPLSTLATSTATPYERMQKLFNPEQLKGFEDAIGEEASSKLRACTKIEESREILAGLPLDVQSAILAAAGRDNILEMATWK